MKNLGPLFDDDTEATETMRGHFFFSSTICTIVFGLHLVGLKYARDRNWNIPGEFQWPHLEVKVALVLSMGVLDCSFAVLCSAKTAPGWKALAVMESLMVAAFVYWFFVKARDFKRDIAWVPLSNVPERRGFFYSKKLENGVQNRFISEPELVEMLASKGRDEEEAKGLFRSLDKDGNGLLDYAEFNEAFGELMTPMVPFEKATFREGIIAMFFRGGCEAGRWFPKEGSNSDVRTVNVSWFVFEVELAHF